MADDWFEVAPLDHFWMRRRFEVLQRQAGDIVRDAKQIAEIGCGHGAVQRQIEDFYGREVSGFDLHEAALKGSLSQISPIYCYDIFDRNPQIEAKFDLIVLFDVIEHLKDEDAFLSAVEYHLAPKGRLLINVPALQFLFSRYDVAQGHFRRYSLAGLESLAKRNGWRVESSTYWGLPMVPLLWLRKQWLKGQSEDAVVSSGFATQGAMNKILLHTSRYELIPQRFLGTSVMAVLQKSAE
jgi:SAM-dependent methyltransferase